MKIKIYKLAADNNEGTWSSVYGTREERAKDMLNTIYDDDAWTEYLAKVCDVDPEDVEAMCDLEPTTDQIEEAFHDGLDTGCAGTLNTYSTDEEEIDVEVFGQRPLGAVLAGLRILQYYQENKLVMPDMVEDIMSDGGSFKPLDSLDIDDLCERLNG